jgi:hypothetical protein
MSSTLRILRILGDGEGGLCQQARHINGPPNRHGTRPLWELRTGGDLVPLTDACKIFAELEQENAKLKKDVEYWRELYGEWGHGVC